MVKYKTIKEFRDELRETGVFDHEPALNRFREAVRKAHKGKTVSKETLSKIKRTKFLNKLAQDPKMAKRYDLEHKPLKPRKNAKKAKPKSWLLEG